MAYPFAAGEFVTAAQINTWLQPIGLNGTTAPGWVDAQTGWAYVSASSFKVAGADVRNRYPVGTKLSCTDSGTKQGYAGVATYAGGDTTVPFIGDSLTGGTITNPRYSYVVNPYGFPSSFAFTPSSYTGWAATPTFACRLAISGGHFYLWIDIEGTANGDAKAITLPLARSASVTGAHPATVVSYVGAAYDVDPGRVDVVTSTATFYRTLAQGAYPTSGTLQIFGGPIIYPI